MVVVAMVTWEDDPEKPGEQYATTHFDMYRVENGLIAEHWDHVPKSPAAKSVDPNSILEKAPKNSIRGHWGNNDEGNWNDRCGRLVADGRIRASCGTGGDR
jgi:hypothetical protein